MKYMRLNQREQRDFLADLESMPEFLDSVFGPLTPEELRRAGPDGSFCPLEHVWHLADLEREGFAVRIERLRTQAQPQLPDFDGGQVALEGNYKARSFGDGLAEFRTLRASNVALLRTLAAEEWMRAGEQEGVGPVSMCDMPAMMAEHDAAHRAEIEQWRSANETCN